MTGKNVLNPEEEGERLLSLDTHVASEIFQSYSLEEQLEITEAIQDSKRREELYYLVPDCTRLIQNSQAEYVWQILDRMLQTGLACGILPILSENQFKEILELSVFRDGILDDEILTLWIEELLNYNRDDRARLLVEELVVKVDFRLIAYVLKDHIDMSTEYKMMFGESINRIVIELKEEGIIELEENNITELKENGVIGFQPIEFENRASKFIMEIIWSDNPSLFSEILYEVFPGSGYEPVEVERSAISTERYSETADNDSELGQSKARTEMQLSQEETESKEEDSDLSELSEFISQIDVVEEETPADENDSSYDDIISIKKEFEESVEKLSNTTENVDQVSESNQSKTVSETQTVQEKTKPTVHAESMDEAISDDKHVKIETWEEKQKKREAEIQETFDWFVEKAKKNDL